MLSVRKRVGMHTEALEVQEVLMDKVACTYIFFEFLTHRSGVSNASDLTSFPGSTIHLLFSERGPMDKVTRVTTTCAQLTPQNMCTLDWSMYTYIFNA